MNGFAALDIPPCRRYVVVKATAGFAVCRLILKLLLFYSCLDFTQNLGKTLFNGKNAFQSIDLNDISRPIADKEHVQLQNILVEM